MTTTYYVNDIISQSKYLKSQNHLKISQTMNKNM